MMQGGQRPLPMFSQDGSVCALQAPPSSLPSMFRVTDAVHAAKLCCAGMHVRPAMRTAVHRAAEAPRAGARPRPAARARPRPRGRPGRRRAPPRAPRPPPAVAGPAVAGGPAHRGLVTGMMASAPACPCRLQVAGLAHQAARGQLDLSISFAHCMAAQGFGSHTSSQTSNPAGTPLAQG